MDVVAYLEAVREQHLNRFEATAAEARERYGAVELEVLFRDGDIPFRFDLKCNDKVENLRLQADVEWTGERNWETAGIPVTVLPVAWDGCLVIMKPAPRGEAIARILAWYAKWLAEPPAPREPPFRGVVHSLVPHESDGMLGLQLDLGTAPTDALLELLQLLPSCGVQAAALRTFD